MPDGVVHYPRYRFPSAIISHAVWLSYRFTLRFSDVEDLLAQYGIIVSHETVRHWCQTFGRAYAWRLRRQRGPVGDTWYLDEAFVTSNGRRQYVWRAVDQDGEVIDIPLSPAGIATPQRASLANCSKRLAGYHVASSPIAPAVTAAHTGRGPPRSWPDTPREREPGEHVSPRALT